MFAANGENFLGGMYYDIEGLLDEGFSDKTVHEDINSLADIVEEYMADPESPTRCQPAG